MKNVPNNEVSLTNIDYFVELWKRKMFGTITKKEEELVNKYQEYWKVKSLELHKKVESNGKDR